MNDVELRRGIGYVIQQGGLFPHFTVADNVAVVPRLLGWSRDKRRQRACELLALVGLPPEQFADRYPRQLSGGQQQRVGVARALAADPPIVLMDEPFGAVDPITRKQLQRELRRIQAEVQKTIVFVTHDIAEAFLLGDRIVLMAAGRVVQNSPPADLLRNPADPFVTSFIGEDRGLRSLQFTSLAELAAPPPADVLPNGLVLPGTLSILDAGRELGLHGDVAGEGFWIGDDAGQPTGYLTYQQFAVVLGETIGAADVVPGEREAHGLPA
jgi:osmoprotectant transport system ATP-binding protein